MGEEFIEDIIEDTKISGDGIDLPGEELKPEEDVKPEEVINSDDTKLNSDDVKPKEKPPEERPPEEEVTIEDLATQIGWNSNYQGEDAVDAATFILRSREIQETMKDHNKDLKSQLSTMQNSIDSLKDHNERVYKTDVRRMQNEIEILKKQKREAVELADVKKVDAIDKKIDDLQKDIETPKAEKTTSTNTVYDEWIKDNQWYLTDSEMAAYAETIAKQYEGAPASRIYKIVRQKVAEVFPDKFEDKKTDIPATSTKKAEEKEKPTGPESPVEGAVKSGARSNFTKADLNQDQLGIMNQFVKQGIMTEEQYIKDIAKMQEG